LSPLSFSKPSTDGTSEILTEFKLALPLSFSFNMSSDTTEETNAKQGRGLHFEESFKPRIDAEVAPAPIPNERTTATLSNCSFAIP